MVMDQAEKAEGLNMLYMKHWKAISLQIGLMNIITAKKFLSAALFGVMYQVAE